MSTPLRGDPGLLISLHNVVSTGGHHARRDPEPLASDVESAEHLQFLGAVITVVADGDDTSGALTVTQIDAPRATRTTSTRSHREGYRRRERFRHGLPKQGDVRQRSLTAVDHGIHGRYGYATPCGLIL
jgi:hypothetical protein